jgi:hypothetical protein
VAARDAWLARVNQLKQYVAQHPGDTIPEFLYLSPREWLVVMDSSNTTDLAEAMGSLKSQAESAFAIKVSTALRDYEAANNGQFPNDLSQLQPYGDASMEEILQQRYEIKPVGSLSQNTVSFVGTKSDWIIASRFLLGDGSGHVAIYPNGYFYF